MAAQVRSITADARRFIEACEKDILKMKTVERIDKIVQLHQELRHQLQTFHERMDKFNADNQHVINYEGADKHEEYAKYHESSCALSDRVDQIWSAFQNELLTQFPQADIDYRTLDGRPLIGDLKSSRLLSIPQEFKDQFPNYRSVRADGNCFYTSFTIGYLQWLVQNPEQIEGVL
jgi:hypothetical protein